MYRYLFFDLDGTLTDSSEGIFNCLRYALEKMGTPPLPHEVERLFIGPPLQDSFTAHCGYTRQQVLFDVSLSVNKGTCLGILGESGSGKSTMGRVLCGLLRPDSGEVLLDGVPVYGSRAGRRNLQNKLSVVFQDYTTSANPRFRVRDVIGAGWSGHGKLPGCWSWWACPLTSPDDFPMSSPVASFSGCASPGLWPAVRRSSFSTRPSRPWTLTPRSKSWTCCEN